jgi:hypothetical protein
MTFSLRARLLTAIVAAVVLVFLCSLIAARIVLGRDLYDLGRTEVTRRASAFDGYITAHKQQIQLLVSQEASSAGLRRALQTRNAAALRSELDATAAGTDMSFLTVVDDGGRVLARANAPARGSASADPLVLRALNGETFSTLALLSMAELRREQLNLQVGSLGNGLAIVAGTPISDARDRTIGALYGGILLNHSYDVVDETTRAIGGASALLDGDTIVSSSILAPDGTRYLDARVAVADAVMREDKPFVGEDTEGGTLYLARVEPMIDDRGRVLGAAWYGIPMAELGAILTHTTWTLILWGLIAVALVLALAIPTVQALSKTLVTNSRLVREAARQLGVIVVGSEVSTDHVSATKEAVERSGRLIAQAAKEHPSPALEELAKLNEELHGDVTVIETLASEMSGRMRDAADHVAELNEVAAGLNELVTGESGA